MLSYMVCKQFKAINWTLKLFHTKLKDAPFIKMAEKYNLRWAIKASDWQPTYEEILAASSYIQTEEKERIAKFVFKEDAKSTLLGRLLLRKFAHLATGIPYEELRFGRDDFSKPYLLGAGDIPLSINVSHQGEYVVLAGHSSKQVGIDVMKIEAPANKDISEFFRLMSRQLTPLEWETIKSFPTEREQVMCFYRIWCLKESYIKNIGVGLTVALNQIGFRINTRYLEVGKFATDSEFHKCGVHMSDWIFEETLIEDNYAVAVSVRTDDRANHKPAPFQFLTYKELVQEGKPMVEPDSRFSLDFIKKEHKTF